MTSMRFFKVIKGLFIKKYSSDNTLWCKQYFHGIVLRFSSVDSWATTSSSGICVAHYSRNHQSRFYFLAFKFQRISMWLVELFFSIKLQFKYFSEILSTCKYCILHLSRKIIMCANIIDILLLITKLSKHFKKNFFFETNLRFFFFLCFDFIISMDHIENGYFYNHMLVVVSDRFKNYSVKRYLCYVIPVWGLSNDLHVI